MQEKHLLWTHGSVAAATNGTLTEAFKAKGVSIDSRNIEQGDIFVALKSDRDGHYFVRGALEKGASAAIVIWRPKGLPKDAPLIFVKNSLHALIGLGKAARRRSTAKVIAVTGSSGKTSTKEMLHHILARFGHSHAAKASHNNHWGVPLSLANMPIEAQFGVFEIGMNKSGEIDNLVRMVCPHIGIITTIGSAHRGFFDSEEAIAKAKAEIMSGILPGGVVILNKDNSYYDFLKTYAGEKAVRTLCFGEHEEADARLLDYDYDAHAGQSTCHIALAGQTYTVKSGFMGKHQAMNAAAVLLTAHVLELDIAQAASHLESFKPVVGRGQTHILNLPDEQTAVLLDESYNANPLSMNASFEVLKNYPITGRKILVLADMRELGDESQKLHEDLADNAAAASDRIYTIGQEMRHLAKKLEELGKDFIRFDHVKDAVDSILDDVKAGDVLLLKGSNGMRLNILVKAAVERFTGKVEAEQEQTEDAA